MAWIRKIPIDEATGRLKEMFDEAIQRAGRVYQVVHLQSQNPAALDAGMQVYRAVMYGHSPLKRYQREMIAVVVSRINECHY